MRSKASELVGACVHDGVPILHRNRGNGGRRRWLELRQRSLGASEVAAVLGLPEAYTSAFALWWAKQRHAPVPIDDMTEEMEWGLRLEDAIADRFAEGHPELAVCRPPYAMYASRVEAWRTCSPDRLAVTIDRPRLIPVELKTDQNPARWDEEWFPDIYRVQLLWQCAVFGVLEGYIAALIGKRYREYHVVFTQEEVDAVLAEARAWWANLDGDAPDVDGHDATRATLMRLYYDFNALDPVVVSDIVAAEYQYADGDYQEAKRRLALAKNRLLAEMGESGIALAPNGRKIATRRRYQHPGATVRPHPVDGIWRAKGGRDEPAAE